MQVVFHAGAHSTDEGRLLRSLWENKETLRDRGIETPAPRLFRSRFRQTFDTLKTELPSPEVRETLLSTIPNAEGAKRLVLSNDHFFGTQWSAVRDNSFYPLSAVRMAQLSQVFEGDQLELFMGLCNPGTFIPKALLGIPETKRTGILRQTDVGGLRWSDMVAQILQMAPGVKLTFWRNEDTPLIWGKILRELAGVPSDVTIRGEYSLLGEILTDTGRQEFHTLLSENPDLEEHQVQGLIADVLGRHAREDMIEEELDLAGWTSEVIDAFTEIYAEDVAEIRAMPGVNFLVPG